MRVKEALNGDGDEGGIMKASLAAFLMVALICNFPSNASATKTCEDDSISSVSDDGDIVKMLSGSVWEIDDADQLDTQLWLAAEDLLICSELVNYKGKPVTLYTIINTDSNGEKAGATRLR